MSIEVPPHRFEFQRLLRIFKRSPKAWTPEMVKREGFVQNKKVLKDAVAEILLNADDTLQERLNFLAGYSEEGKGFTVEAVGNKVVTTAFTIGLGEKDSLYFLAKNPRIEGEEIHKFATYSSITTREDLLNTIRNFILLEPKVEEKIGVTSEAIQKKIEKYRKEVEKGVKADKVVEGFKKVVRRK